MSEELVITKKWNTYTLLAAFFFIIQIIWAVYSALPDDRNRHFNPLQAMLVGELPIFYFVAFVCSLIAIRKMSLGEKGKVLSWILFILTGLPFLFILFVLGGFMVTTM